MKAFLTLFLILIFSFLSAFAVSYDNCRQAAQGKLNQIGFEGVIADSYEIIEDSRIIAIAFELCPEGYVITSCDDSLPPVIAYSITDQLDSEHQVLQDLIKLDIKARYSSIHMLSDDILEERAEEWRDLQSGNLMPSRPEQWPPEGSTPTGGWLLENWSQSSPWNSFCPLDNVTGGRSLAGCPSIAMGQIVNYHRNCNNVFFDDSDDYYHSYAGRQYWVDDDWQGQDFLSFPQINTYMDSLQEHYIYDEVVTSEEKAALVFACGAAARQVYTSEGSGTFGLSQAYDAFLKFNFDDAQHLDGSEQDFWEQIQGNIMDAMPVHFATISATGNGGHNFVVDGYNTDGFFHCNYGWGGGSNGWYLLPDEVPYNLTVIEGAIVDIIPEELASGFIQGNITLQPASQANLITLEISKTGYCQTLELEPQESGVTPYICQVPIGSYTICASYPEYENLEFYDIIVNEFESTEINIEMCELIAPNSLTATQNNSSIELEWEHDFSRELCGFKIYRNIEGTAFMLLDYTEDTSYIDLVPQNYELTFGYYITSVYSQENESSPSDTVYIDFSLSGEQHDISPVSVLSNYPNPFNPQTTINFNITQKDEVKLEIYNIKGERIIELVDDELSAGEHSYIWQGLNSGGYPVSSGVYYYRLTIADNVFSRKCLLLK